MILLILGASADGLTTQENATILHRTRSVIHFLRYHGWAVSQPLRAYPLVAS